MCLASSEASREKERAVTSMLSHTERDYLREYASAEYSGAGAVVDLGCWLGSSTIALADGLRRHPDVTLRSTLVHAYDLFIWDAWMDRISTVVGTSLEGKYRPGDSFLEECRRLTEPWKDNVAFYPGDLSVIGWSGGPIEFLFVDAMKSWALANSIIHDFYPSLIPGSSIVVQQDFGSFYVYWLHLLTSRFRDYFEPICDLPCASSVVFKYVKQIPEPLLRSHYDVSSFSSEEIDAAFEYAEGFVGSVKRAQLAAAKVRCYLEKGDRGRADQAFLDLAVAIDMHHGILLGEQAKQDHLGQENDRLRSELEQLRLERDRPAEHERAAAVAWKETDGRIQEDNLRWRAEVDTLRSQLERAQSVLSRPTAGRYDRERQELESQLRLTHQDLDRTHSERDQARNRIIAMESTKFWKLRRSWFQLKRVLHLPGVGPGVGERTEQLTWRSRNRTEAGSAVDP